MIFTKPALRALSALSLSCLLLTMPPQAVAQTTATAKPAATVSKDKAAKKPQPAKAGAGKTSPKPATKPSAKSGGKASLAKTTAKKAAPTAAAAKAAAIDSEAALYKRALKAVEDGAPQTVETILAQGHDPVLNKVVRGYAMALPGNDYSFEQLNDFIMSNPGWPGLRGIQMIAEQKIPDSYGARQLVAFYTEHPPVTEAGFYKYIDALNLSGMAPAASAAIRARWIENDMSGDEMTSFYSRFASLLDANAMWARMDRLLWKGDSAGARRMMPYVSATDRTVAEARLALANGDRDADSILSRVSSDARNDPGLLYQKLRWLVKSNRDSDAEDLLTDAPDDLGHAESWWTQRNLVIRRAMERRDFTKAYRLAADHGQTKAKNVTEAEFMAGWLALRFMNRPDVAARHFQGLYDNAGTPVTKARGAYWLGRTYEAAGNRNAAEQAYQDAAAYNTTFYGQLATTRIYANPVLTAKVDPPLPDAARQKIMARDRIRAIIRLNDIGEPERARSFFRAAADSAQERAEFVVLADIAQANLRRPDLGIQAVKAAAQKNMLLHNGGFPLITLPVPTPPEIAFTHAVIRQESLFNPEAGSSAGARGLMQLMPGTARETARKVGIAYSETKLLDTDTNLRLGTFFLQSLLDKYEGSYVLALAGYNAGPGRVREWINLFGDPRTQDIDPIDWIELIPMSETRNYVQRIMENLQIYRAKLAGGTAPLTIARDLRR